MNKKHKNTLHIEFNKKFKVKNFTTIQYTTCRETSVDMQGTIDLIRKAIRDESTTTNRSACSAVCDCLHILLDSKYFKQGLSSFTNKDL